MITPALTPHEWRQFAGGQPYALYSPLNPERRHAIAALALYGQSFGFTHAHVDVLTIGANGEWRIEDFAEQLAEIRDLIEALLPPRKICSQCGKDFNGRACGPTHALITAEMRERGELP